MDSPLLWFANRGTGMVLMLLLTLSALLGLLATQGDAGRRVPRFVTQSLHRNLSLLSLALLGVHAASAVLDEYVDIRWWQAVVPFGATYKPLPLGLGALALDVMAVVVATSLLRHRLRHRHWRIVHLSAYAAWAVAMAHGFLIGTDSGVPVMRWLTIGCVASVAGGATTRAVAVALAHQRARRPAPLHALTQEAWEGSR